VKEVDRLFHLCIEAGGAGEVYFRIGVMRRREFGMRNEEE
jgi:hypothetical protein